MRKRVTLLVLSIAATTTTLACKPRLDSGSSVKESNVQKLNDLDQVQVVYRKGESVFLVTCKPSEIAKATNQNVEDIIFVSSAQCNEESHNYQELPIGVYRERLQYLANYQKADYEKALVDIKGHKRQLVVAQTNLRRANKDLEELTGTSSEGGSRGENSNREKQAGAANAQEVRELRKAIARLTSDKESAEQQVARMQEIITTNEQRSASVEKIIKLLDPMDSKMNADDQTAYGIDHTFLVSSRTGDLLVAPFSGDRANWTAPDEIDPIRRNAFISAMNGKDWVMPVGRDYVNFSKALKECAKVGGRLPTPSELLKLATFGPIVGDTKAVNDFVNTDYLWTAPIGVAGSDTQAEVGVFEARDPRTVGYYSTAMSLSQEPDWHGQSFALTASIMRAVVGSPKESEAIALALDPRTLNAPNKGAKALCLKGDDRPSQVVATKTGRYFLCETKFPSNRMDEFQDGGASQIITERVVKCVGGGESRERAVASIQSCVDRVKARWKKSGYATPDPLTSPDQSCVEVGAN